MNLQDKVIVITGSGRGLGRAMAVALASKKSHLALIDLNQDDLNTTAELCRQQGVTAKTYISNIANEQEVENTFNHIVSDFGALDGLINNAGIIRDSQLIKVKEGSVQKRMSLQEWQAVIDVNLTGVFLCGREAATKMIELNNKEGVIINISSLARGGSFGQTNYSAAKAGVVAMATCWAKELSKFNIRTGAIAPGTIETDMLASMHPASREALLAAVPLGRLGKPEDIAKAAVFIFENEYFSGSVIEVDAALGK
jgi:3-oxoacyl-[acyl-carrier protein] reductase